MSSHSWSRIVLGGVLLPALSLSGCGSSSDSPRLDAQADGRLDAVAAGMDARGASPDSAFDSKPVNNLDGSPLDLAGRDQAMDIARVDQASRDGARESTPVDTANLDDRDSALVDTAKLDSVSDRGHDTPTAVDGGARLDTVTLSKAYAWADCMPSLRQDPVMVTWTVDITGALGSAAKLTKATITVTSTKSTTTSIVQDFDVENPTVTLVDGAGKADQRKPVGTILANSACSQMCGGATFALDLVYDVDGLRIPVSSSGNFSCAY